MPQPPKPPYETPHILSDAPLSEEQDQPHFHFDDFAVTLARLIADRNTRTPLALCVSGPWGSGLILSFPKNNRLNGQMPPSLSRTT